MATQTDIIPKKAFARDYKLQLGDNLVVTGTLFTPRKAGTQKGDLKMACPICARTGDATGVDQRYICKDKDHGVIPLADCVRMKPHDDGFILVAPEDLKKAKAQTDLPEKLANFSVHNYDATEGAFYPCGMSYVFEPDSENTFYAALLAGLDSAGRFGDQVLITECLLKGEEKVMRLARWNNQVVLQELVRPEDVDEFSPGRGEITDRLSVLVGDFISSSEEDFDPSVYKSRVRERIAALTASEIDSIPAPPRKSTNEPEALETLLERAIAEVRKAKKVKK